MFSYKNKIKIQKIFNAFMQNNILDIYNNSIEKGQNFANILNFNLNEDQYDYIKLNNNDYSKEILSYLSNHDIKTYLADDIMCKTDRASMYYSQEIRSPYLDYELYDYVSKIPTNKKIKAFHTKTILKSILGDYLNKELIDKNKQGFQIPLTKLLKTNLKEWIFDIIMSKNFDEEHFNKKKIIGMYENINQSYLENMELFWSIVVYQNWKANN